MRKHTDINVHLKDTLLLKAQAVFSDTFNSFLFLPEGSSQLFSFWCGGCPLKTPVGAAGGGSLEALFTCRDVVSVCHSPPLIAVFFKAFVWDHDLADASSVKSLRGSV